MAGRGVDRPARDGRLLGAQNGGTRTTQLACEQRQGAWGAHGIHYFFSGDTDNAASPEVPDRDRRAAVAVHGADERAVNVGDLYGNVVKVPLQTVAVGLGGLPVGVPPVASDVRVVDPDTTAR